MRPTTFSLFALVPLIVHAAPSFNTRDASPPTGNILDDEFETWLQALGKDWGMKGLAISVVRRGSNDSQWNVETKGYGIKDRLGNPVTPDTLFSIGSNTKLFTALSLGLLVSNPNVTLDWKTKVASVLPNEWKLQDPVAEKSASIADILSHRTGLPRHDSAIGRLDTIVQAVSKLRFLRPSAEFRETFQYNNFMYITASLIIERLSNSKLQTFVNNHIFAPLGMNASTLNFSDPHVNSSISEGFALVTRNASGGEGWTKSIYEPVPYFFDGTGDALLGAGGVISSATDMATWLQTLLLNGRNPKTNVSVIAEESIQQAATGITVEIGQSPTPELSPFVYGAGQYVYTYQGHEAVEHDGSVTGFHSIVSRYPNEGLGVSILTNWDDGALILSQVLYKIVEKALNLTAVDWDARVRAGVAAGLESMDGPPTNPNAPPTSIPFQNLAGNYSDPGYGHFELCALPGSNSQTKSCTALIRAVNGSLTGLVNPSIPTLVGAFDQLSISHILLQHLENNTFEVFVGTVPPPSTGLAIYGASPVGQAEFVIGENRRVEGIAISGGAWGAGSGVGEPEGSTPRERAEVWFNRD